MIGLKTERLEQEAVGLRREGSVCEWDIWNLRIRPFGEMHCSLAHFAIGNTTTGRDLAGVAKVGLSGSQKICPETPKSCPNP